MGLPVTTPLPYYMLTVGDSPAMALTKLGLDRRRVRELVFFGVGSRTTTQNSAEFQNPDCSGLLLCMNVTGASGTGGLQPVLYSRDSTGGNSFQMNASPTAVTTTLYKAYLWHPTITVAYNTAAGVVIQAATVLVSKYFLVSIVHGDASSYTYSVTGFLIP
jgi:hypothetical protein